MKNDSIKSLVERTWNSFYPNRKPWKDIAESARDEWMGVFKEYERQRHADAADTVDVFEAIVRMVKGETMMLFGSSYTIVKGIMDTDLRDKFTFGDLEKHSYYHGERGCATEEPRLLRNGVPHALSLVELLSHTWRSSVITENA